MKTNEQIPNFSPELQKQISILNARISNANIAQADLLKELNNTFTTMMKTIAETQKENIELKIELKESTKKQQK